MYVENVLKPAFVRVSIKKNFCQQTNLKKTFKKKAKLFDFSKCRPQADKERCQRMIFGGLNSFARKTVQENKGDTQNDAGKQSGTKTMQENKDGT